VLLHKTRSIICAGNVDTGVHTPVATACQVWRTTAVTQADGQGWVAVASTDADWMVVQDTTCLVSGAGGHF